MRRPFGRWGALVWTGILAVLLAASPTLAVAEDGHARATDGPGSVASDPAAARADRARGPRPSESLWMGSDPGARRSSGPDAGWSGMACLALVLAVCGGIAVAARRLGPRASAGAVQVVGRVSLSPKHSVYLLRVGRRVLVLGAGPQGPPALITELDELPQELPPAPRQEVES